jgi:hypothetical protein
MPSKPIDIHFLPMGTKATCRHCGKAGSDQGLAKVTHLAVCKPKKLLIANGRGDYGYRGLDGRLFVCAASKADAVRLLVQAGHERMNAREFNKYWSKGAWGNSMEGVERERGVWFTPEKKEWDSNFKPIKLL